MYPPISPPRAPDPIKTATEPPEAISENPRTFWSIGRNVNRLRTVVTLNRTTENRMPKPMPLRFERDFEVALGVVGEAVHEQPAYRYL